MFYKVTVSLLTYAQESGKIGHSYININEQRENLGDSKKCDVNTENLLLYCQIQGLL